ncbi:MAG: copper chaperone PCu(A)C [Alphaproteobacteria bacterium]|jgi:copper(I)-binding protein|nr:copper chaperone PCu(A)C [Alphaproteobacteria bacterium]
MHKALLAAALLSWGGIANALPLRVAAASAYPAPAGGAVALQLVLENPGAAVDLVGASTPVAQRATVRVHQVQEGVTRILTPPFLTLPARSRVHLLPGANEVFLSTLQQPLVAGMEFPLLLSFTPSQTLTVRVAVRPDLPQRP